MSTINPEPRSTQAHKMASKQMDIDTFIDLLRRHPDLMYTRLRYSDTSPLHEYQLRRQWEQLEKIAAAHERVYGRRRPRGMNGGEGVGVGGGESLEPLSAGGDAALPPALLACLEGIHISEKEGGEKDEALRLPETNVVAEVVAEEPVPCAHIQSSDIGEFPNPDKGRIALRAELRADRQTGSRWTSSSKRSCRLRDGRMLRVPVWCELRPHLPLSTVQSPMLFLLDYTEHLGVVLDRDG